MAASYREGRGVGLKGNIAIFMEKYLAGCLQTSRDALKLTEYLRAQPTFKWLL